MINADGSPLGVISKQQALKIASEQGLDLVEIAPNVKPPVAKVVDFQKFRYQEEKKEQAARKNAHEVELKEIWLSPRIDKHDLEVRLKKVEEFLAKGDKVKLTIKFRGREMIHPENGHQVLNQALSYLGDKIKIEREAKFEGRSLTIIFGLKK